MPRIFLNWQDSGVERLLIVIGDTRANRRVFAEYPEYLARIPRIRAASVIAHLQAGRLPPTGWTFF